MRHRLIPTRGRGSRFTHGREAALEEAREMHKTTDIPVLVVHHPEGGTVTPVTEIGSHRSKRRKG